MPEAQRFLGRAQSGVGEFVRRSGYLRKWLILGIAIGVIAGLGAVLFYLALEHASQFLLGYLGGYDPPTAAGDGGHRGSTGFERPWAIPLVTFAGALVSALIVAKFAPEAEGHGTDNAIEADFRELTLRFGFREEAHAPAVSGQAGHHPKGE